MDNTMTVLLSMAESNHRIASLKASNARQLAHHNELYAEDLEAEIKYMKCFIFDAEL